MLQIRQAVGIKMHKICIVQLHLFKGRKPFGKDDSVEAWVVIDVYIFELLHSREVEIEHIVVAQIQVSECCGVCNVEILFGELVVIGIEIFQRRLITNAQIGERIVCHIQLFKVAKHANGVAFHCSRHAFIAAPAVRNHRVFLAIAVAPVHKHFVGSVHLGRIKGEGAAVSLGGTQDDLMCLRRHADGKQQG